MTVVPSTSLVLDIPGDDPIRVTLVSFGGGCGQIVIRCWTSAWVADVNRMGTDDTSLYVSRTPPAMLVNKFLESRRLKPTPQALLQLRAVVVQMCEGVYQYRKEMKDDL